LTPLFAQIVTKAEELGLVSFNIVSVDGTKIYADASRHKNLDPVNLEKQMQKVLEEARKLDDEENKEFGNDDNGSGIPPDLKTLSERNKKRKDIEDKKMKDEEQKKILEKKKKVIETKQAFVKQQIERHKQEKVTMTRINTTDPDSRLVQMKRKDW
jgi:hypothetical protein